MKEQKYYVTMTDKFMSDWGHAKDMNNKLVFVCDSYHEALIVSLNAEARSDQKYINIRSSKPYYNQQTNYVQFKTKDDYPSWYVPGYFGG